MKLVATLVAVLFMATSVMAQEVSLDEVDQTGQEGTVTQEVETGDLQITKDTTLRSGDYDRIMVQDGATLTIADGSVVAFEAIHVMPGGTLLIGSEFARATSVKLVIKPNPLITATNDPAGASAIMNMGTMRMYGVEKTIAARFSRLSLGQTELEFDFGLNGIVDGWQVGDRLYIPDLAPNYTGDLRDANHTYSSTRPVFDRRTKQYTADYVSNPNRVYTITRNDCGLLSLDRPLQYDVEPITAGGEVLFWPTAFNLSRSIEIASAEPDGIRGHVMSMLADAEYHLEYVQFRELGRTLGLEGSIIGRYSGHHAHWLEHPGQLIGCTVDIQFDDTKFRAGNVPKWGFVNHNSHYQVMRDCIATEVSGAGFAEEHGTGEYANEYHNCWSLGVRGVFGDWKGRSHGVRAGAPEPLATGQARRGSEGAGFWLGSYATVYGGGAINCHMGVLAVGDDVDFGSGTDILDLSGDYRLYDGTIIQVGNHSNAYRGTELYGVALLCNHEQGVDWWRGGNHLLSGGLVANNGGHQATQGDNNTNLADYVDTTFAHTATGSSMKGGETAVHCSAAYTVRVSFANCRFYGIPHIVRAGAKILHFDQCHFENGVRIAEYQRQFDPRTTYGPPKIDRPWTFSFGDDIPDDPMAWSEWESGGVEPTYRAGEPDFDSADWPAITKAAPTPSWLMWDEQAGKWAYEIYYATNY